MFFSFKKKYNLVNCVIFFALCVSTTSFIASCTSTDKLDIYSFETNISGPFTTSEIIKRNDVILKDGINLFDSTATKIYIIKINNNQNEIMIAMIDAFTGELLADCRYFTCRTKGIIQLVQNYGFSHSGPVIKDTIFPNQIKNYYFYAILPDSGIIETRLNIKSGIIDSLNDISDSNFESTRIKIDHPYFLFEVKDRKIIKRIDGREFHKHIKFQ